MTKREIKKIRSFFLAQFLASYDEATETIVIDLDAWDALTHGEQQLSLFHGYYGPQIYLPVLINIANQFRLFLAQAAYILMLEIRQAARGTRLAKAQVSRLRETIIKTAAKVSVSSRRVLVELASHCPFAQEINLIVQRLSTGFQWIFN